MNKRKQQTLLIGGLSLLGLTIAGVAFARKKDDEPTTFDDLPPLPADPAGPTVIPADPVNPSEPRDIDDLIKPVPMGASFYQVKYGDIWLGKKGVAKGNYQSGLSIAVWLLRREAYEAAREYGKLSEEAAWVWVNAPSRLAHNSNKYIAPSIATLDVILCSAFNDSCYGTWGYCGQKAIDAGRCPPQQRNRPGPHGRGIRLLPQHANNIARFKAGDDPARYCPIGSPNSAGDGLSTNKTGRSGKLPAIWCPMLDRERLWATGAMEVEAVTGVWEDGSPMSSPPPGLWSGRVLDYTGTLTLPGAYGCGDQAMQIQAGG